MKEQADTGLLDIFLKPLNAWIPIFRELPKRRALCYSGISGVAACFLSLVLIGGIPYDRMFDWGIKEPPKQNLMGALMSQAQQMAGEGGHDNLEDAISDFAGKAELEEEKKKPEPRETEDCVILGYRADDDGMVYSLVIGAEHRGKLQYAGTVPVNLREEEKRDLSIKLAGNRSKRPFVKVPMKNITWVVPKFLCRVSYARKGKQGGLYQTELEALLSDVKLPGM